MSSESLAQAVARNSNWINTVISNSKLSSQLSELVSITSLDQKIVVQEGVLDAKYANVKSIRGYKGLWNATTNIPTLSNSSGVVGDVYKVSVAGNINIGSGSIYYVVGDLIYLSEDNWIKISPNQISDITGLQLALDSLAGGLIPQGNWNALSNVPDIGTGATTGQFWIVSVAGSTNVGGITDWEVNDWAVRTATGWAKIDNTDKVLSVAGRTGVIVLGITDITGLTAELANTVKLTGNQSIAGQKTFTELVTMTDRLKLSDSAGNTLIGDGVGTSLTTGAFNVGVGLNVLQDNTIGTYNVGLGDLALHQNTEGSNNFAGGSFSMWTNSTGSFNVAIGFEASRINTTGSFNVAIGSEASKTNTTGENNIGIGKESLWNNRTGSHNIGVGLQAGKYIANGVGDNRIPQKSIFIGQDTRANADGQTNQIVIGDTAIGNGSNTVTLGNNSIATTYLKGDVNITGSITGGGGDFLPLAGGTLTGALTGTSAIFTGSVTAGSLLTIKGASPYIQWQNVAGTRLGYIQHNSNDLIYNADVGIHKFNQNATFVGKITGREAGSVQLDLMRGASGTDGNTSIKFTQPLGNGYVGVDENGAFSYGTAANLNSSKFKVTRSGNATFAGNVTTGASLISTNAIVDNVVVKTANGNLTFKTNGGSTIAQFRNDLSATFAGSVTVQGTGDSSFVGNVGIGTTNPSQAKLVVNGDIAIPRSNSLVFLESITGAFRAKISSQDSNPYNGLEFYTGNDASTAKMIIEDDGNVGIGTDSPSAKLHVDNSGFATTSVRFDAGAAADAIVAYGNGGKKYFQLGEVGATDPATMSLFNNEVQTIRLKTNGNSFFNGGNVGIGTDSPIEKLQVEGKVYVQGSGQNWNETTPGTTIGSVHFDPGTNVNNTGNALTFGASDASSGSTSQAGIYTRSDATYGTKMYFATTNDYASGSKTAMMIDYNGNVGIGTTSPLANLDIASTNTSIYQQWSYASDANNYNLQLTETVTSGNVRFVFDQKNAGTQYSDVLVFNQGKIGIGTAEPGAKLDVDGVIRAGSGGSTSGSLGFEIDYSGANVINTWSTEYSSSDSVFGVAVRAKSGVANAFTSTAGNAAFSKGALVLGDDLEFLNAPGTTVAIGSDVVMTSRFKINSSGNVGIGTDSPAAKLDVKGTNYVLTDSGQARGGITVQTTSNPGNNGYSGAISLRGASSGSAAVSAYQDGTDGDRVGLAFITHASGTGSGDSIEAMRITSAGNVSIGDVSGVKLSVSGGVGTTNGTAALPTHTFYSDKNTGMYRPAADTLGFSTGGTERMRIDSTGHLIMTGNATTARILPQTDTVGFIGESTHRWNALYATIGTIQTSDEREKTEVKETSLGLDFINDLKPVSYKWIDNIRLDSSKDERKHQGLIAQQVGETLEKYGINKNEFGGLDIQKTEKYNDFHGMSYEQIIAPMIKAIQELKAEIEILKAK